MTHASHPAISKRLKRSHGHLRKIIEMIEEGRPCAEIAQQLYAVEKAVQQAKKTLIHDHIDHCLSNPAEHDNPQALVAEFREISKYL
ncbi:metal-sensing transcriptional repressor [Aliiruegeria sabulilitoris]|uniref:metal-sensing transcriptional repressor n=1 Tax=Aliiruegeria sabulilitoris TaxID=1510458 RepID=UPI000831C86B|nr:metal-sensing transcriptional repressor [Aliiruegeria sabulilitoris]NDR59062.1 metal-sensing transcriptional repressor [Pseudoruegeria sp. M32A2M]